MGCCAGQAGRGRAEELRRGLGGCYGQIAAFRGYECLCHMRKVQVRSRSMTARCATHDDLYAETDAAVTLFMLFGSLPYWHALGGASGSRPWMG